MAMSDVGVATSAKAVTPSNSVEVKCRGIYVGGGGNVVVTLMEDNATVTFLAVPAGVILPVAARLIMTASTATNMVALF